MLLFLIWLECSKEYLIYVSKIYTSSSEAISTEAITKNIANIEHCLGKYRPQTFISKL